MPNRFGYYRGIEIRRLQISQDEVTFEELYGVGSGRLLATDNTIDGLKRKIDQLLDEERRRRGRSTVCS